jgi:hypothetical protein
MPEHRASTTGRTSGSLYSRAFKEGISSLMGEIQLAFRWSRPSILVAVHKGSAGQEKARAKLRREITALGRKVRNIETGRANLNLIQSILKSGERSDTVFFISGIGKMRESEKREIYRALNFHRELLVENRVVLVLWLALPEAAEFPRFAPDFWAFRHRVVEFAPDRSTVNKVHP